MITKNLTFFIRDGILLNIIVRYKMINEQSFIYFVLVILNIKYIKIYIKIRIYKNTCINTYININIFYFFIHKINFSKNYMKERFIFHRVIY